MGLKLIIPNSMPAVERRKRLNLAEFQHSLVRMARQMEQKHGDPLNEAMLRRLERKTAQRAEAWREAQL